MMATCGAELMTGGTLTSDLWRMQLTCRGRGRQKLHSAIQQSCSRLGNGNSALGVSVGGTAADTTWRAHLVLGDRRAAATTTIAAAMHLLHCGGPRGRDVAGQQRRPPAQAAPTLCGQCGRLLRGVEGARRLADAAVDACATVSPCKLTKTNENQMRDGRCGHM